MISIGVSVEFLSPYSPDFNPIEEHFGALKRFIKKIWHENEEFIAREFGMFSEWCVDVVSDTANTAMSHFRHVRIIIPAPKQNIINSIKYRISSNLFEQHSNTVP